MKRDRVGNFIAIAILAAALSSMGEARASDSVPDSRIEVETEAWPPADFEPSTKLGDEAASGAEPFVYAAYVVIWALLVAYLVLLWRRQKRVGEEIEMLRRRLERLAGK